MSTSLECVCCREIQQVLDKLGEIEAPALCITEHPGFSTVCLDMWVLQTAFYQYRQHYGPYSATINE